MARVQGVKLVLKVLSVDWDYFFPNIEDFDWGHREEPIFQTAIWSFRPGNVNLFSKELAIDSMVPKSGFVDFWSKTIINPDNTDALYITESHAELYLVMKFIGLKYDVVNFDQHHDLGYGQGKKLSCGNWAQLAIEDGLIRNYKVVYPEWREKNPEGRRVESFPGVVTFQDKPTEPDDYHIVFICRSSAWTPSWADEEWLQFVSWWKDKIVWQHRLHHDFVKVAREPGKERALELIVEFKNQLEQYNAKTKA